MWTEGTEDLTSVFSWESGDKSEKEGARRHGTKRLCCRSEACKLVTSFCAGCTLYKDIPQEALYGTLGQGTAELR
jgi:hypothetical protein